MVSVSKDQKNLFDLILNFVAFYVKLILPFVYNWSKILIHRIYLFFNLQKKLLILKSVPQFEMPLLFDKVALITGASRGVGYAAARKLCEKFPGNFSC